jgi:hypothetical protein
VAVVFIATPTGPGITPISTALTPEAVMNSTRSGTAITIDTAIKEHGYGSWKHDSAASASAYFARASPLADAGRRITFWFRIDNTPTVAGNTFMRILTAGDGTVGQIGIDTNRNLRLYAGATGTTLQATGSTVLSLSTWYKISFCYTITSASVSEWRVYLGTSTTPELTASNPSSQIIGSSRWRIGWTGTAPGANIVCYTHDYYIDDSSALTNPNADGLIRVTEKRPSALGNLNNFDTAVGAGANRWDRVNERPANSANRYTQAGTTQQQENYTVQAASVGDDDITGAPILAWAPWVYYSVAAASGSVLASIIANGSPVTLTTRVASGVYQGDTTVVASTSYPSGNNVVGLRSSGSAVDVHLADCGVFIAYTPAVAASEKMPLPISTPRQKRRIISRNYSLCWQPFIPRVAAVGGRPADAYSTLILATADLAAYYRLDEPSGTLCEDSGPNSIDLTYTNTPSLNQTGLLNVGTNPAVDFEQASSQYAIGPTSAFLQGGSALTVEMWVRPESFSNFCPVGLFGSGTDKGWWVNMVAAPQFWVSIDGSAQLSADSSLTLTAGVKYHLVATYDGETSTIWIDAVQRGSNTAPTGAIHTVTTANAFALGRLGALNSDYYDGILDEVSVYNRVLSSNEINQHFTVGSMARRERENRIFQIVSRTPVRAVQ